MAFAQIVALKLNKSINFINQQFTFGFKQNALIMLKNVCYLILLLFVVTACTKKNTDPAPDAAARIAGSYDISRYVITGSGASDVNFTWPETGTLNGVTVTRSGVITVTKVTETTVAMMLTVKITGRSDTNGDLGTVEIKGTDLYEGTTKVGTADGSTLNLDATDAGARIVINSTKK